MGCEKSQEQKKVTKEHRKTLKFNDELMSPQKNAELEPQFKKYKGRVVLRGNNVKDDSGAYAVCTDQGSSASQMMAAKVMDVVSRLLDCDEQAADAISAYTQVKMEGCSETTENSQITMSACMDTSSKT